jgi:hypothetical protein
MGGTGQVGWRGALVTLLTFHTRLGAGFRPDTLAVAGYQLRLNERGRFGRAMLKKGREVFVIAGTGH